MEQRVIVRGRFKHPPDLEVNDELRRLNEEYRGVAYWRIVSANTVSTLFDVVPTNVSGDVFITTTVVVEKFLI